MEDHSETKRFYDRISRVYDALSDSSEHKARELGLALLAPGPGEQVLEIGFGTGHSIVDLARAVGPEGRVSGVDLSEGMLSIATERVTAAGYLDLIQLQLAAVPPLPYADASFDAVVMSFTLELFPESTMDEVLAEIRRVLRPDGRFGVVAMSVPPTGHHDSLLERAYKWMHRQFPHIVDCRPIDTGATLERADFRIREQEILKIWTMPVVALVAEPADSPNGTTSS